MINAKFKQCKFVLGITSKHQIPKDLYVNEVSFAGRSNVGKSSLLNALTYRKNLAKISKTPGRTQQINFFTIKNFITLVDLPGYGYSKVARSKVHNWSELIAFYILSRKNLKQLFLLIDARRSIQKNDIEVIEWLESYSISYTIVITKTDKVKKNEADKVIDEIKNIELKFINTEIITTSVKDNIGLVKLRNTIINYVK